MKKKQGYYTVELLRVYRKNDYKHGFEKVKTIQKETVVNDCKAFKTASRYALIAKTFDNDKFELLIEVKRCDKHGKTLYSFCCPPMENTRDPLYGALMVYEIQR